MKTDRRDLSISPLPVCLIGDHSQPGGSDEVHALDSPGHIRDARSPEQWGRLSQDEQNAVYADYQAINETPGVTPGLQLAEPETASTSACRTARP